MLPDLRYIAALPTSWALTLWDALPIILSVELAVAIGITLLLSPSRQRRVHHYAAALPTGAVVYLLTFDSMLFVIVLAAIGLQGSAALALGTAVGGARFPNAPGRVMLDFAGQIVWAVMKGAAAAAVIKVMLSPGIDSGSPYWLIVGALGGALVPVPLGVSAIPALAVQSASGSMLPATLWIVAAAARPLVLQRLTAPSELRSGDARSTP